MLARAVLIGTMLVLFWSSELASSVFALMRLFPPRSALLFWQDCPHPPAGPCMNRQALLSTLIVLNLLVKSTRTPQVWVDVSVRAAGDLWEEAAAACTLWVILWNFMDIYSCWCEKMHLPVPSRHHLLGGDWIKFNNERAEKGEDPGTMDGWGDGRTDLFITINRNSIIQ